MNKKELIAAVSEKSGLNKKESEKAINAVFEAITESLVAGDKIQASGFGIFDVKARPERQAINPRTKEVINVPASRAVSFKAAKALKDEVNK